jgi:hypothetical protein
MGSVVPIGRGGWFPRSVQRLERMGGLRRRDGDRSARHVKLRGSWRLESR